MEYNDDPTYLKDSVYKEIYYMDGLGGPDFSHPENSKGTLSGALLSMMYKQLSGSMTRVDVYDQALAGILHIPFTDAQGVERVYITGSGDKTYVVPWSATEGIDAFKQWDDPYGMQYRSIVTTDQNNALVTIIATEFPDDLSEEQQRIFSLFGIASILSDPTQKEIGFTQKLSTLVATSGEPVNPHIMVSP
ncbi:MAG: hypothetical protein HZB19_05745 [Chloroflexi bacterium]|nr:hypothetical protein [Chloroflexota bacterium]